MIEAKLFAYELLEELRRDLPFIDWASAALPGGIVEACVVVKAEGIAAGVDEAAEFLKLLGFQITLRVSEGAEVKPGGKILCFRGEASEILKVERVLLNLLMHASGVATYTRRLVTKAKSVNPRIIVAATRKTLPFLRYIEKKAVWIGGGDPHRFSLSDSTLFKDNHRRFISLEHMASSRRPFVHKVEVEVNTVEDALRAAEMGFDIIMLDNMTPEEVERVAKLLAERGLRGRVILEASGNITEDNIHLYAPHVDVISVGRLTHSAPALDMSLEIYEDKVKVGLIGYGRLGEALVELAKDDRELEFVAVYDTDRERCIQAEKSRGIRCVNSIDELITPSEVVVEAASAQAVLEHGCKILEAGRHLIVASVGALSKLPKCGRGYVFAISGAVGGVDIVASTKGVVRHVVRKAAFRNRESGEAEELYWKYPRSLNVSMTYKLAGAERVEVELLGDAPEDRIIHEVEIAHRWGKVYIRAENYAKGTTSYAAALSLYNTLKNVVKFLRGGRFIIGTFTVL